MNLFNLRAKLGLDKEDYDKGLKDASKDASSFSSKAGTVMKGVAKAFAAVSGAVSAAGAAVFAFGNKMVDLGGDIDDNAQRLGMSTDQYQLWSFAMTKAGTEVSTLQRGMIQLSTWTENLSNGQADALKTLDDLGIGYEEFMAMDNAGQLQAVTNALQGMEDQTEKANLAQQLFGDRVAQQMMPLFNEEQGSIDKLNETLREQGVIVGEENIQAAAQLGDKIDLLKATFTSFALKLSTDVFPEIGKLIDGFQGLATGSEDASQQIADALVSLVDKVVAELPKLIYKVCSLALDLVKGIMTVLPSLITELLKVVETLLLSLLDYLPELTDIVFDVVIALIDGLIKMDWGSIISKLIDAVMKIVFEQIPDLISNLFSKLINAMNSLFSGDGLKKFANFGVNLGISLVNGVISGLNKLAHIKIPGLKIGDWQVWDDVDVQLFTIPTIPLVKFAKGGMFDELEKLAKGTAYAVAGEDGTEIVAQGRNGTGVANVEQIADAQYMALKDYRLNETITASASAIVNGIVSGMSMNNASNKTQIVVQIGEKDFKSYIVKTVNETLNAKGRKNLNTITAY